MGPRPKHPTLRTAIRRLQTKKGRSSAGPSKGRERGRAAATAHLEFRLRRPCTSLKGSLSYGSPGLNGASLPGGVVSSAMASSTGRRSTVRFHHVLCNSGLSDLEAELQELAMNARGVPERVLEAHLVDQTPWLRIDLRAPSPIPGLPSPIAAKSSSMPTNRRLGPNDVNDLENGREPAIQLDEEKAVAVGQPNPALALTSQYDQLVPKRGILRLNPRLQSEQRGQDDENEPEKADHPISLRDSLSPSTA